MHNPLLRRAPRADIARLPFLVRQPKVPPRFLFAQANYPADGGFRAAAFGGAATAAAVVEFRRT